MQIRGHADRAFRPEPSNKKYCDQRQKRRGRRWAKKQGTQSVRTALKRQLEHGWKDDYDLCATTRKSFRALGAFYSTGPAYGGWREEYGEWVVWNCDNVSKTRTQEWVKPAPRNHKTFQKWRKHQ